MDPETRFSEEEVQLILARAARKQDRAEDATELAGTGFTLTRLQEVAADVGIAPLHIESAAREVLLHRDASSGGRLLGLPRELRSARAAPGVASDAQWERMVGEFRQIFKVNGIPSQFGEVREWISTNEAADTMPVIIRLEPGEGGTKISVRQSVTLISSLIWGLSGGFASLSLVFGMLVGLGLMAPDALLYSLLMLGIGAVSGAGGWLIGQNWTQRQQRALERAADRAEIILRS
jgi:hypothetical protein